MARLVYLQQQQQISLGNKPKCAEAKKMVLAVCAAWDGRAKPTPCTCTQIRKNQVESQNQIIFIKKKNAEEKKTITFCIG